MKDKTINLFNNTPIKLRKITFTGIDNETDVTQLKKLAQDYLKVEFGLVLHDKSEQSDIISLLSKYLDTELSLSLHVCGGFKRRLIHTGDWSELQAFMADYLSMFQRVQLNGCGKNLHWNLSVPPDISEVIIQQDKASDMPFYQKYLDNKANIQGNFTVLFDSSSGRGKHCEKFESANLPYIGYAGGLGPNNVLNAVRSFEMDENVHNYWIDMQTGVRDENNCFSVDLCRKVCEALGEYAVLSR